MNVSEPARKRRVSASAARTAITAAGEFDGERMTVNRALREQHGRGEEATAPHLPDAVACVEATEEISGLLALCHRHGVPLVPLGAGSGLEGQVTPVRGGIGLDLSRMAQVLEVNAEDMDCRIEPGATREQLNTHLRDQGLFFSVDPGAECTIGGMCAIGASGTNAVRYGEPEHGAEALRVMSSLKAALDPKGILNPGKLFRNTQTSQARP